MWPARILRILTLLAVLLMPLGMIGGSPAMASGHHKAAPAAAGHCADMDDQKKDPPGRSADCTVACAAIPAFAADVPHRAPTPASAETRAPLPTMRGLDPEAATPPPRPA